MSSGIFHKLGQGLSSRSMRSIQNQSDRFWLVVIFVVAVLLRAAVAFYFGDQVVNLPGTQDQLSYDMLAQRVLGGYGFTVASDWWPGTMAGEPTAHWSYLYVLYLTAIYALLGYHPLIARLVQAIVAGLVMPWLVYRIGRRYFRSSIGLVASGLAAIYAYFVYYAGALMTETFYILAVLWTLDLAGKLGQNTKQQTDALPQSSKFDWLWLGLALATAVLLRQVFLLFIPFLFMWLLWRSYRVQARSLIQMIGILFGAGLILLLSILPWTARNYRAFDRFVLLNTNAGFAFFWGNHPIHGHNFISILPQDGPSYQDLIPPELWNLNNEAALDQALLKQGLAFIQEDPGRYIFLSFSRFKDYFKFWPSPDSGLVSNLSRVFSFGILWPFMLYGVIYGLRNFAPKTLILYLFMIIYTGIHILSWTLIRYRLPVDAVLIPFAGLAIVELYLRLSRRLAKQDIYPTTLLDFHK